MEATSSGNHPARRISSIPRPRTLNLVTPNDWTRGVVAASGRARSRARIGRLGMSLGSRLGDSGYRPYGGHRSLVLDGLVLGDPGGMCRGRRPNVSGEG